MARYVFRQAPGAAPTNNPQPLGDALAAKKNARQTETKRVAPVRLSATSSRQKQELLDPTFTKGHATSAIQLLKMRQRAAKELHQKDHFLGDDARRFLHLSAAGKKLQGEELKKFIEAGIKGEIEATTDAISNPLDYKVRHEGERHLESKANVLIRKLKKEAEHQASLQQPKPDEMAIRRERLDALHARISPPTATPATATAIKPTSTPMAFMQPPPLPTGTGSGRMVSRYLNSAGGHAPTNATSPSRGGSFFPTMLEPTPIAPVASATSENSNNSSTPVDHDDASGVSNEPTTQEPDQFNDPVPTHPVVPDDTSDDHPSSAEASDEE